ncbi:MAG: hypothetical protein J6S92_10545 [Oscillospiraceae bacterium]|nr:hypothetical protein [Oscillospiraceae bacterium]
MNLKRIKPAMLTAVLLLTMLLGGCGDPANYDLPAQPQEFKVSDFTNPELNTDAYASIEYNGRSYIPFGTLTRKLKGSDVGECLGYITQMDLKDEATRILLLQSDSDSNFLIAVNTKSESLETTVMRAIDMKKKDIPIPDLIKDEEYEFWK